MKNSSQTKKSRYLQNDGLVVFIFGVGGVAGKVNNSSQRKKSK